MHKAEIIMVNSVQMSPKSKEMSVTRPHDSITRASSEQKMYRETK